MSSREAGHSWETRAATGLASLATGNHRGRIPYPSASGSGVVGAWLLQGAPRPSDPACGTTDPIVREGAFHAWQIATSWGYSWRVRLLQTDALEGLPSLRELVRGPRVAILDGPSATGSLAPRPRGSRRRRHQELIEVLKRELEARHGRVHEMHVLLRSNRAPKLPRVLYPSARRWRVLWRRLAARMLNRRQGELAPAHL